MEPRVAGGRQWPHRLSGVASGKSDIDVEVVDTTGCGDGFDAGFVTGLLLGCAPADAAWLAVACGSLVATGLGSDAGIESLPQVLDFLRAAQPEVAERIGTLRTD